MRRFVGPGRATWYEADAPRARQLLDILHGPSTQPVPLGPGLVRVDACYPHVCNIRAALFVARGGEIRGAALLYPDCGARTCSGDEGLKLTILRDPAHADVARLARRWADEDVAARNAAFDFMRDKTSAEETVDVPQRRR